MIRRIRLRNFRAFRDQTFNFGRINIFVGPNNSGKSSAISALNLIAQTYLSTEYIQTPLHLNGQFDDLGTFKDIVYKNRSNTPLGIDISFDEFDIKMDFKYRAQRREIEITRYEIYQNDKQLIAYVQRKDSFDLFFSGENVETLFPKSRKRKPSFSGFFPDRFSYDLYYLTRSMESSTRKNEYDKWREVERGILRARQAFRRSFYSFDSLGPFREKPDRTYLYSGETATRIGSTGTNTATILSADAARRGSERKAILEGITKWFQVTGIAQSIQINAIGPRHFELVLVEHDGSKHNISDVGFGCSQVLPVLAATINTLGNLKSDRDEPVLVIQEPEIHLHPNAQAALGSFFSGIMPERGQLFLETHSDNLLLRIAQHVADGTIDSEGVRIFYVHKEQGSSVVSPLEINSDGTFGRDWPGGFFPQRQTESLALARAAARANLEENREKQLLFRYPEENK